MSNSGNIILDLPSSLTVIDGFSLLDGGTSGLIGRNENGELVQFTHNQFRLPGSANPGRLFFQNKMIEVRSEDESKILQLLETARIDVEDDGIVHYENVAVEQRYELLDSSRQNMINYIKSETYVDVCNHDVPDDHGKRWWQFWKR